MLRRNRNSVSLLLVLAMVLLSRGVGGQSLDSSHMRGFACETVRLSILDANGRVVTGASVYIGDTVTVSDSAGWVETRGNVFGDQPVVIKVMAEGYQLTKATLQPGECSTQINLVRSDRGQTSYTSTVPAEELRPDVREQSIQLQLRAEKARARADYAASVQLLLEAWHLTPSDPAISNNLGVSFLRRGDLGQSSGWFEKAASLAPFDPKITGNLGLIRWAQGRDEESRQLLTKAIEHGYSSPAAHYVLGIVAVERGSSIEAIRELSMLKSGQFPYRGLFVAIAFRKAKKYDKAAKEHQRFLQGYRIPLLEQSLGKAQIWRELGESQRASGTGNACDITLGMRRE